jgi:hypothetical protein
MRSDVAIITMTIHPIKLDSLLLVLSFRMFLSLAIRITAIRIGRETTPLITELYTTAPMGSMVVKLISKPITVEATMISRKFLACEIFC